MRVLLLTQWFDPEPVFKVLELASELMSRGHEVEVLTGFPNYPAGRLYPGFRLQVWQRELINGVPVMRIPLYPSHSLSAVGRTLNYVSFAISAALLGPFLARRPNVIYAYHPPGTVGLPALVLGAWYRAPVVYDVQDLWPDTLASTGILRQHWVLGLLDHLCRFVYRQVEQVVVLSPGFRTALIERGIAPERVHVIYNWAPRQQLERPGPVNRGESFPLVFAGTMGLAQGLDTVLEAASLCAHTVPRARFVFVGDGVDAERLKQRAGDLHLSNVDFLGRQPLPRAQKILAGAGALLVHLKDDPLFCITIPSKTQAYLAAGQPVLMAVSGDAADLIVRSGGGVVARPGDSVSIASAVHQLAEMPESERARMASAGRKFYEEELSISRAVEQFERVLQLAQTGYAKRGGIYRRIGKRCLDAAISGVALVFLLPLLIAAAVAIRLSTCEGVFFRQLRVGKDNRIFTLWKFRSLSEERDARGELLSERQRTTRLGRILRSTSLDELPELWNVFKGDISLVGPRPLLVEYLPHYSKEQARRHELRPGITGLAQVCGRNSITWARRLSLDVEYVNRCSFALDCRIIFRTVAAIFRGDGGLQALEKLGRFRGTASA